MQAALAAGAEWIGAELKLPTESVAPRAAIFALGFGFTGIRVPDRGGVDQVAVDHGQVDQREGLSEALVREAGLASSAMRRCARRAGDPDAIPRVSYLWSCETKRNLNNINGYAVSQLCLTMRCC